MLLKFIMGREPDARFSEREKKAALLLIGLLTEYGKRMADADVEASGHALAETCISIGLLPPPEVNDVQ